MLIKHPHKVGINDHKIWRKEFLIMYLYQCTATNTRPIIDVTPEASSCYTNGLYRYLDVFCEVNQFPKKNITIRTGNMLEHHDEYCIVRDSRAWFEIPKIQEWLQTNIVTTGTTPTLHFGHFIGKANWHRLWIASILNSKYSSKSFQTFNAGFGSNYLTKNDGLVDYIGMEDLVKHGCDIMPNIVEFLQTCPRTIPEDIEFIKTCATHIKQDHHYPIQFPANFNVLKYYDDVFVEIVHESYITGDVFFATEKTWRPILARRPFITMGSVGHLANLRRLGFRTFNDFWDEGYDDCGISNRIGPIAQVLEQISSWTPEELSAKLAKMKNILDHNYHVLRNLTQLKIAKTFDA